MGSKQSPCSETSTNDSIKVHNLLKVDLWTFECFAVIPAEVPACAACANLASLRACISELASESPAGVYNQVSSPVGASGLHSERSSAARVLAVPKRTPTQEV